MPRGKIQMSLIGDARDRARAFTRRKAGLLKKAQQLAKLCDVYVALVVCAGPDDGAGAAPPPVVWESDPGAVIDRYRRLPADKRAKRTTTHLGYIDGQLGKEQGRLARKRRRQVGLDAFACPGETVLKDMNLEKLLASIDAALLATAERQKALGVAAADDGGQQLGQVSSDAVVPAVVVQGDGGPPPFVSGGDDLGDIQAWFDELMWDGAEPLPLNNAQPASGVINGNDVDMGSSNHQCQVQPGNGDNGHGGQLPWHAYQPLNTTTVSYPDYYGFQCAGNNCVDMDEHSSQVLMPSNANAAYDGWYDQASWWGADVSSRDAVAGLPVTAAYPSLDIITGNPAYMPRQQEHPSMGIGGFMDAGGHEYETGCLADYLQCPDGSQRFGEEPEPVHYLSDMAQGVRCNDDLEAGGGCSWRAQLFAQSQSCSSGTLLEFSGSEQSQSDMGQQYQGPGPGVERFWVMEGGPPGSTAVGTASARGGVTWANTRRLYQPCISVYQ